MGSERPSRQSFAARAAYFGDRMCGFCDHRNPADAKYCNACAAPLHLKPCERCGAVNDEIAATCHQCGAARCAPSHAGDAATDCAVAASSPATPAPEHSDAAAMPPQSAADATRAHSRLRRSGRFLATAILTILVVGGYEAYRASVAKPQVPGVASVPVEAAGNNAPAAPPIETREQEAVAVAPPQVQHADAGAAARDTAIARDPAGTTTATNAPAPKRASAHRLPAPMRVIKRDPAHPPMSKPRPALRASAPTAPARASDRLHAAHASQASQPAALQAMHVSLGRCDGDPLARIVCDQRLRREFCEGRWGEMADCAGGLANDHGQ